MSKDAFEASVAAHYLARQQPSAEETFRWNKEALERADAAGDGRIEAFYPSLYLNMGKSHEDLGDLGGARISPTTATGPWCGAASPTVLGGSALRSRKVRYRCHRSDGYAQRTASATARSGGLSPKRPAPASRGRRGRAGGRASHVAATRRPDGC